MLIKSRLFLLNLIIPFMFTGCYTVVWHPNEELPNNENSVINNTEFYDIDNFGVFKPFYNSPWWLNPDNDFLIDNVNTIMEIQNVFVDIQGNTVLIPVINTISVNKRNDRISNKQMEIPTTKTKTRTNKESKKKIRNNNGDRKTANKGRNR